MESSMLTSILEIRASAIRSQSRTLSTLLAPFVFDFLIACELLCMSQIPCRLEVMHAFLQESQVFGRWDVA
jgi:hypothetical protein